MLRLSEFMILLLMLVPVALSGQQITQVSPMDSLVTLRDLRKACTLHDLIPVLPGVARENQAASLQDVQDLEDDLQQADAAVDAAVRAGLQSDLDEANTELARNTADVNQADEQLRQWTNALSEAARTNLQAFCNVDASSSVWDLTGVRLPSRSEVKTVAAVDVVYNPRNIPLDAIPGGFLPFAGISESRIVSGLTSFLVDRAAQEIQLAFIDRFKNWACEGAREVIFESTCVVLGQAHLALHSSVLREFNTAVEKDLRRLPRSAPLAVAGTDEFKNALGRSDAGYTTSQQDLIITAYYVGAFLERLLDGSEPLQALGDVLDLDGTIIDDVGTTSLLMDALAKAPLRTIVHPVSSGLYRLALVSKMLPDVDDDGNVDWPDPDSEDRVFMAKALVVNLSGWLAELDVSTTPEARAIIATVSSLMRGLTDSHARLGALEGKVGDLEAADGSALAEYAAIVDDALGIAEVWTELIGTLKGDQDSFTREIASLRGVAKSLTMKDYSSAILGIYSLADDMVNLGFTLPDGAIRFLSFATALAQAESASETTQVIQAYAAPVQSYRAKRNGEGGYLLINGYLGGSFGRESAANVTSNFAGVSAPFGLEVGGPIGGGWSLGLFGQLLDVGALASYRITSDSEQLESEPEIGLGQVFSPGAYAILGLPNLPVAFGVGWSFAPALRKVSDTTDETENATRWNLFLSVDIPVLVLR